jgi:hypothetical protein
MNLRTIAAGAAMLACLSLAATPAPAETATSGSAVSKAHARPAKAKSGAASTRHRQARAQHGKKKTRIALTRHRQRPAAEPAEGAPESVAPARQETPAPARQETAAARRFREFLSPQSFALGAGENLRRPRLLAAHLTGDMTDPQIIAAAWSGAEEPDPQESTASIIAHDDAIGDDNPSPAPVLTHGDGTDLRRVARADSNEPERMSFVRWFFVAWGGVLTFASALRMAVG